MIKIKKSSWTWIAIMAFIALAVFIWFNIEKIILYSKINSPIQEQWATFQLTNGEILYGHLAGITDAFIGLKDVFTLEKYVSAPVFNPVATSSNFAVTDSPALEPQSRLIPSKNTSLLFLDRQSIIYWKFVDPNDPMASYLK
jgi:hypothetical protein